jgi:hypothetical protein
VFARRQISLHVHERIDPHTIIDAVRKRNGSALPVQASLFERREENPPLREAIDFYRHAHGWSNRLIAGDSLLVMNSLLKKEGMAGQVQMVSFAFENNECTASIFCPGCARRVCCAKTPSVTFLSCVTLLHAEYAHDAEGKTVRGCFAREKVVFVSGSITIPLNHPSNEVKVVRYSAQQREDASQPSSPSNNNGQSAPSPDPVRQEIDKIRNAPHAAIPLAQASGAALGGQTRMTVENATTYALYVYLSGPISEKLEIVAGGS